MSLSKRQISQLSMLISRLRKRESDCMVSGLTAQHGLLHFIAGQTDHHVSFTTPYGCTPIMLWNQAIVTQNNTSNIASTVNDLFGPYFYREVLMASNGDSFSVSVKDDILPLLLNYQEKYDKTLPVRVLKEQLVQVRNLLQIADNPAGDLVKKNIPGTTVARWRTLEKHIVAEIVNLESF